MTTDRADNPAEKDSYFEGEENFSYGGPEEATGFCVFDKTVHGKKQFFWQGYRKSTSNPVGCEHGPFYTAKEAYCDAKNYDGA